MNRNVQSCLWLMTGLMLFVSVSVGYSQEQYKKFGNQGITLIVDGKYEAAIKHYEEVLGKYPGDLESYYGLAMAYAQKRQIDKAIEYVEKAVEGGLPFGRFWAGPRDLLSPLTSSPKFKVWADKHAMELLHGPMLGGVTDGGAKFWLRTVHEVPVEVFVKSAGSQDIGSRDPWQGYKAEREQIFSFLEANRIDGVILIAADRHRSDAWKIERENGYDLYEFESSRLTNIHTHKIMPGSLFGYNKKCSFGLLGFDTTRDDPQVTYRIVNIDNEIIREITLTKSQLAHTKTR